MAYEIIERESLGTLDGDRDHRITAVLDSASDLTALGTNYAPGSVAMVVGGAVYMMNASGVWKEL